MATFASLKINGVKTFGTNSTGLNKIAENLYKADKLTLGASIVIKGSAFAAPSMQECTAAVNAFKYQVVRTANVDKSLSSIGVAFTYKKADVTKGIAASQTQFATAFGVTVSAIAELNGLNTETASLLLPFEDFADMPEKGNSVEVKLAFENNVYNNTDHYQFAVIGIRYQAEKDKPWNYLKGSVKTFEAVTAPATV